MSLTKRSGKGSALTYNEMDDNLTHLGGDGTYQFPSTDGSTDQVLATNGSGQLSFVNPSTLATDLPIKHNMGTDGALVETNVLAIGGTQSNKKDIINIGQRGSTNIAEVNVYAGDTGKVILHYGDENNPTLATLQESQRLHTTARGIHVGSNLVGHGTYTAGDNQINNDRGFGFVVGSGIENYGYNTFAVGQEHNISLQSNNNFVMGYNVDTTLHCHQSMGIGTHVKLKGASSEAAKYEGMLAIGKYVEVRQDGAVGIGTGLSNSYLKADGRGAIALGDQSQATANYAFAQGDTQNAGSPLGWMKPISSATNAVCFGPNTVSTASSFSVGKFNRISGSGCTLQVAIGDYNNVLTNRSVVIGKSNVAEVNPSGVTGVPASCFAVGSTNTVRGDHGMALGKDNIIGTYQVGNILISIGNKSPQRNNSGGWASMGDGQVVVGRFNDVHSEYTSADYTYGFVQPLALSVGTGAADGSRYTSMAVGPRSNTKTNGDANFCGIIMQALAESKSYTDAEAASSNDIPAGGLYRTNNTVKIKT